MPPAREDVVQYLRSHLKEFPVEELRRQLATEGVDDFEFDEALKAAKLAPPRPKVSPRAMLGKLLLLVGFVSIVLAVIIALRGSEAEPQERASGPASAPSEPGASAYVGKSGWVVRLPAGYTTTQSFRGAARDARGIEVVHLHKASLDKASLLDEGLFGPLGIVRMEAQPNPFAGTLSPIDSVTAVATGKARERGEKFSIKPLQVSSLKAVQLTFEAPHARVETYVVGERSLYSFYAGQDDDVYREILFSLRDAASE